MPGREDRTQKPTAKRRREARREGRVARSPDLGSWLSTLTVLALLPTLAGRAERSITNLVSLADQAMAAPDNGKALELLGSGFGTLLAVVLPVAGIAALMGLGASLAQVGIHLSPGALGFKLSKISPRGGIKRLVSTRGLWDLAKNLARMAVLAVVGYGVARQLVVRLLASGTLPLSTTLSMGAAGLSGMLREVAVAALLFGVADYAFQRRKMADSLKMTREEVKRELKETEGNPEIRRAIRRRQRALTRMQMIAAVTHADVVVVNPTHFAVGLAYERAKHRAPTVLAKGEDDVAAAIRSAALDCRVPVVESPLLARALYAHCQVGDEIPPALYEVVAKLFAFVYRLSPTARSLVEVHHLAASVPGSLLADSIAGAAVS